MRLRKKRYYGNYFGVLKSFYLLYFVHYRLRKGKVMMVLGPGQYYCISLCKERDSIKLSFVLLPGDDHPAEQRIELLQFFQFQLEQVMEDFMSATSKAVAYIPCCYCSQLHMKLKSLLMGRKQHCPNKMQPIPMQHYHDLVNDQGLYYHCKMYYLIFSCSQFSGSS